MIPKWLLFEEILATRPFHESRLLWRDAILWDPQRMGLDTLRWYDFYQTILSRGVARDLTVVTGCWRTFNCYGDLTRHCISTVPVSLLLKQSCIVDVAEWSITEVISPGTSNSAQD